MKKSIFILFIMVCGFYSSFSKAENNSIGVHAGSASLSGSSYATIGLVYENRFSESFGFAASYDSYEYKNNEKRSISILGFNYYPVGNLQLGLGFGSESSSTGSGTGARASIGYAIDFESLIITPSYRIYGNAKELGVTIQVKF